MSQPQPLKELRSNKYTRRRAQSPSGVQPREQAPKENWSQRQAKILKRIQTLNRKFGVGIGISKENFVQPGPAFPERQLISSHITELEHPQAAETRVEETSEPEDRQLRESLRSSQQEVRVLRGQNQKLRGMVLQLSKAIQTLEGRMRI